MKTKNTCSECGVLNCYRKDKMFPSFCLTEGADRQVVDKISRRYRGKNPDALIAHAAINATLAILAPGDRLRKDAPMTTPAGDDQPQDQPQDPSQPPSYQPPPAYEPPPFESAAPNSPRYM